MSIAAITALLRSHWYDAAHVLLASSDASGRAAELAQSARRVLDLDAEDFGGIAQRLPDRLATRLRAASFPADPRATERGALGNLVPLFQLMLEAVALRHHRREPLSMVVTAHLMSEYLPHLAWQEQLGHGADPARMRTSVGEKWGSRSDDCPHSPPSASAAKRSLTACDGDAKAYETYLNGFHSRVGDAFGICAMNHAASGKGDRPDVGDTCPHPCGWARAGGSEALAERDARCRLARIFATSELVALRHHAPVGHFFGVPSMGEIHRAWDATWADLTRQWSDGGNPLAGQKQRDGDTEPLSGLDRMVSAVAGQKVVAGTLIADIGAAASDELAGRE